MEPVGAGIHLRTQDRVKVLDALRELMEREGLRWVGGGPDGAPEGAVRLLLLPPRGAWTSLYPEDRALEPRLAAGLAQALGAPAFTVGWVGEAAFFYRAYGPTGELVDEYHSCPDYEKESDEDDASEEELRRTKGDTQLLVALLGQPSGCSADALASLLAESRIERLRDHDPVEGYADNVEPLTRLAEAFALPDLLEDFDELWHIGLDEEEDVDLRYLAYAAPGKKSSLSGLVDRWRRRRGGDTPGGAEPADDDDEGEDAKAR